MYVNKPEMFFIMPMCVVQTGVMEITNHKTNFKAVVNFKPCGWFGKDIHKLEGYLFDNKYVNDHSDLYK
jgi:Oxysterol-binding protein